MFLKIIVISATLLGFLTWERLNPFSQEPRASLVTNLSLGALNFLITFILFYLINNVLEFHLTQERAFSGPLVVFTVLSLDGISYFWHRLSHKTSLLWRLHTVHHTDNQMESSSAFRFHVFEVVLSLIPRWLFIFLVGLPLEGILAFELIFTACNIFQHSNIYLPLKVEKFLQLLFVTPAMHRVHHSTKRAHQNQNFSTIFSFWDKLFRTYQSNFKDEITILGLNEARPHYSLKSLIFLKAK